MAKQLIHISHDFNEPSIPVDYASLNGIELEIRGGSNTERLGQPQEVVDCAGLRILAESDTSLLQAYARILFQVMGDAGDTDSHVSF